MVLFDYPDEQFVSFFGSISQVCSIYRFDHPPIPTRSAREKMKKFKGVHHDVEQICLSIQEDIHRQWFDSTPLSIISVSSSGNLDALDSSFMYTQLLKEIIIDMEYDAEKARQEFVTFCRQRFASMNYALANLEQFELYYELHSPTWWYTTEDFIYSNPNRALRTQEMELIMKMGFYIQDVYREAEQRKSLSQATSKITVYRGQRSSNQEFEKLRNSKGGLLSFNNFLSTSHDPAVSRAFAESARNYGNSIAILFEMEIDPSISSSTFLSLDGLSNFEDEEEILFLMHSVFRIGDIKELEERLWHVKLTLTDDNDAELNRITQCLRDEILSQDGWDRMATLMCRMGKFDKALEIHSSMLQATVDDDEEAFEIARAKMAIKTGISYLALGKYSTAISNFEEALEICHRYLSSVPHVFAGMYLVIGMAHYRTGDFELALSDLRKVQEISEHSISFSRSMVALTYNMIGCVHHVMGQYQLAVSNSEKGLEIQRTLLPNNHPDLTWTCNKIAIANQSMGNYSKALEYLNEALIT
jgi:tetratricopeptide (TPR) repeat protein